MQVNACLRVTCQSENMRKRRVGEEGNHMDLPLVRCVDRDSKERPLRSNGWLQRRGAFQVERFAAFGTEAKCTALWIDFTDRISGKEIDFESLKKADLDACEKCLDVLWEWNDSDTACCAG